MTLDAFIEKLSVGEIKYTLGEKMSLHTTFKIGGEADVFVTPRNIEELSFVLKCARECEIPVFFIGKGSNLLVSDSGIEGAVINLGFIDYVEKSGDGITVGAGASLAKACSFAKDNGLSGMEFLYGIPGSVGGALYMNAGAYGGEIGEVVKSAVCLDEYGNKLVIEKKDMALSYRTSIFKTKKLFIVEVTLGLSPDLKEEIGKRMEDFIERRKSKQPLEYPSAGSTFKRPVGYFAGALIEKNNLKGVSVGGAKVSEKHAGFLINSDNATCSDVLGLIKKVKDVVLENDRVMLEPEVIFVGRNMK